MVFAERLPQSHFIELPDRAGCETVSTGLFPGKVLSLYAEDVEALLGEPVGSGGASGSATDDQDVAGVV